MLTAAIWIARLVLAGLFLYAGVIKAGASEAFATTIAGFSVLPPGGVQLFAYLLPWIEMAAAILILIPRTSRLGADLISCLLATFILAILWALSQGLVVDCGCFGEGTPTVEKMLETLLRDILLLALSIGLARRRTSRPSHLSEASHV
jgi:uncharacterized membrane protein YphA (DoxX/SURF4 family)